MYQIEVTARAQADADEAYNWMAENISPAYAQRWYQDLFKQIETLRLHPLRCPLAAENDRFPQEIREPTYGKRRRGHKYRIIFSIHVVPGHQPRAVPVDGGRRRHAAQAHASSDRPDPAGGPGGRRPGMGVRTQADP
jgi:plasmid stabilization system protein ParE